MQLGLSHYQLQVLSNIGVSQEQLKTNIIEGKSNTNNLKIYGLRH